MSWFRKLIVTSVLGLSLLLPLGIASQAQAAHGPQDGFLGSFHGNNGGFHGEFQGSHFQGSQHFVPHTRYGVFYRPNCNAPWSFYCSYQNLGSAQSCVHQLQCQGYEAYCN